MSNDREVRNALTLWRFLEKQTASVSFWKETHLWLEHNGDFHVTEAVTLKTLYKGTDLAAALKALAGEE